MLNFNHSRQKQQHNANSNNKNQTVFYTKWRNQNGKTHAMLRYGMVW